MGLSMPGDQEGRGRGVGRSRTINAGALRWRKEEDGMEAVCRKMIREELRTDREEGKDTRVIKERGKASSTRRKSQLRERLRNARQCRRRHGEETD